MADMLKQLCNCYTPEAKFLVITLIVQCDSSSKTEPVKGVPCCSGKQCADTKRLFRLQWKTGRWGRVIFF